MIKIQLNRCQHPHSLIIAHNYKLQLFSFSSAPWQMSIHLCMGLSSIDSLKMKVFVEFLEFLNFIQNYAVKQWCVLLRVTCFCTVNTFNLAHPSVFHPVYMSFISLPLCLFFSLPPSFSFSSQTPAVPRGQSVVHR